MDGTMIPIGRKELDKDEFVVQPSEVGGEYNSTHAAEEAEDRRGRAADRYFYRIPLKNAQERD